MEKITESIIKFLRLDNLVKDLTGYLEARLELLKMEIREDVAKAIAQSMVTALLFFMGFLFLMFFSVGLAHFLNQYFEAAYVGFWLVSGLYGVTFLLLLVFRNNILQYIQRHSSEMIKRKGK